MKPRNEGCTKDGYGHEYSERLCPKCESIYCYNCCRATNVDQGGKYQPDYMHCPHCGYDWYEENA